MASEVRIRAPPLRSTVSKYGSISSPSPVTAIRPFAASARKAFMTRAVPPGRRSPASSLRRTVRQNSKTVNRQVRNRGSRLGDTRQNGGLRLLDVELDQCGGVPVAHGRLSSLRSSARIASVVVVALALLVCRRRDANSRNQALRAAAEGAPVHASRRAAGWL